MALAFLPSDACVIALQAGVVAAPRVPPEVEKFKRLRGPAWALVPLGSIVVVVFAIRYVSSTATALTYLALIAEPPLAALALGWCMRGARPSFALAVVPLFVLAWADRGTLVGEGAGALLSALSCVTLGVLLSAVTPASWLKVGIVLMACADTWLVISDLLQAPNATLVAAHPGGGLPQLQSVEFGSVSLGYGDLFVAGLLGAVLAGAVRRQQPDDASAARLREAGRRAGRQLAAALLTFVLAAAFDLLFFVLNELPATVPVALALIVIEVWDWRRRRAAKAASASLPRSTPAAVTPRRAT